MSGRVERALWRQYADIHISSPDPWSGRKTEFYDRNSAAIRRGNCEDAEFAVVIAAYREQTLLPRCLAGVNRTLEISGDYGIRGSVIVVDNDVEGGDETGNIARYFGAEVILEPRKGHGNARQAGLNATRERNGVILTTDADVLVYGRWAIAFWSEFQKNQDLVLAYGELEHDFDFPPSLNVKVLRSLMKWGKLPLKLLRSKDVNKYGGGSLNMAFRRNEALKVGGYNETGRGEDTRLHWDLISKGDVKRVKEAVAIHSKRRMSGGIFKHNANVVIDTIKVRLGWADQYRV